MKWKVTPGAALQSNFRLRRGPTPQRSERFYSCRSMLAGDVPRQASRTLLVPDTASAEAARLYARGGWVACGSMPSYAVLPHGGLCDTTFYYRTLA
jgi:hypothetical protein